MSSTGVRDETSVESRIAKALIDVQKGFIDSLKPLAGGRAAGASSLAVGGGGGTGGSASGEFLPIVDGIMQGFLGFRPDPVIVSGGVVDLTDPDNQAPRFIITGESSADDDIEFFKIASPLNDLFFSIQGVIGIDLTFKNQTTTTAPDALHRKIRTFDGQDLVLEGNQNILAFYDSVIDEVVLVGGSGGGGTTTSVPDHIFATYSSDTSVPLSPPDTMTLPDTTESSSGSSITYNTSTQIITLQGGKTYRLEAVLGIVNAGDAFDFTWYDNDASAAVGVAGSSMGSTANPEEGNSPAVAFVTPPVETDYLVRVTTGSGDVNMNHSFVFVTEKALGSGDHVFATYVSPADPDTSSPMPLADNIVSESGASITYSSATDQVTLAAGTYYLEAVLAPDDTLAEFQFFWETVTGGTQVGIRGFTAGATAAGGVSEGNRGAVAVVSPTTSTAYQLDRTQFVAQGIESDHSYIRIEKMDVVAGSGSGGTSFPIRPVKDTTSHATTGTVTLDLTNGDQSHAFPVGPITGDVDITFSDLPPSTVAHSFLIEVTQDGTGGHDVTFNDTINGTTPTVDTTASTKTLLAGVTCDGGSTFWVFRTGNAPTGTSDFATKQLNNLSSPVLNTSIDFDSNAPTNFNGYTSQIVGNTLVNDATGATWSLPTGDQYDWKINGQSQLTVTSAGAAVHESITFDDSATDPTANGEIQKNGTALKAFTEGSLVSFSDIGKTTFADNVFAVQDDGDATKQFTVSLAGQATGTTSSLIFGGSAGRNYTFPDTTGTVAVTQHDHNILGAWTFANTLAPDANGTRDFGTTAAHWNNVFTENLTLRGSGNSITATRPIVTADGSNVIFHAPAADDFIYQVAGSTTKMQMNTTGASDDIRIRAGPSRVLGFITDSSATTLGTSGTMKMPVDTGSVGTAAAADTDFGDDVGCFGLYLNTIGVGNPTYCIKIDDGSGSDNRWAAITINRTTGALTGSVLT